MPAILARTEAFYRVLLEGAGNAVVESLLFGLHAKVSRLRAMTMSSATRHPKSLQEIRAIAGALARRDAERAAAMSTRHVRSARDAAMRFFSMQPDVQHARAG